VFPNKGGRRRGQGQSTGDVKSRVKNFNIIGASPQALCPGKHHLDEEYRKDEDIQDLIGLWVKRVRYSLTEKKRRWRVDGRRKTPSANRERTKKTNAPAVSGHTNAMGGNLAFCGEEARGGLHFNEGPCIDDDLSLEKRKGNRGARSPSWQGDIFT